MKKLRKTKIIIEYSGSRIPVERDERGLYTCPICGDYLFYSVEDLMHHVIAHARNSLKAIRPAPKRH
ncbi:MAG: hypothetical protein F7B17_00720 [Desulfurococcales archaeon]|nr:hypothetical protein [Desulfurococcales archaeon]